MKAAIKVLSGARSGTEAVFSPAEVTLGRHPQSTIQFDPEHDLDVSTRHAVLFHKDGRWYIRDLDSSNGTLVNGHRIASDTHLDNTDQVRLGANGPHFEFRLVPDHTPDRAPVKPVRAAGPAPRPARATQPSSQPQEARSRGSTTQRIRVEVGRQTRRLRTLILALVAILVVVVAGFVFLQHQERERREQEAHTVQARIDSILGESGRAVRALEGQVEGLATSLEHSQSEVQRLTRNLQQAQRAGDAPQVERLQRQLNEATTTLRNQHAAARIDYAAIDDANQRAVAMIWARFSPDEVNTGTAFAVTPDGKMVTNRHVVTGPDGARRPTDLAIQFANSDQVWRAQLLATHNEVDLAVVRVQGIAGNVPTVRRLGGTADSPRPGDPVASIGFPLGDQLPMRATGERAVIRTTFTAGTVSKILPDLVQIDGYGAQGASGSPIFDREGTVIAVLYGGQAGTAGRVVYAVPISYVSQMLRLLE